ncbi:Ras-related protein Rap-1b [Candida tropicalis]
MVLFRDGIQALTKRYDMCLVGSDGVGKSTLIVHYIYDRFIPDIEDLDALYTKRVVTPDTGGSFQEISIFESDYNKDLYSESREMHILNANTLILVYSIANLKSFIDLEDYYSGIIQLRGPHDIPPICLIGTKFDLESSSREVSYYDGADFAKKINAVAFHEYDKIDPIDDLHHDKQELQEKQINQTKKPQQSLDQDQSPNDCPLPRSSHSKSSSTTSTTKKIRNPIHVMRSKSIERDSSSLKASSKKHGCCIIT